MVESGIGTIRMPQLTCTELILIATREKLLVRFGRVAAIRPP